MHFNLTIVSHFHVLGSAQLHEILLEFQRVHSARGLRQAKDSDVCWVVGRADSLARRFGERW